ncbi:MAG: peptide chain release factor 1 [Acidobacteria bacterium]|nr:MAG: peptide chain release factor 1 [Acidobacteriota bacterium]
MLDRLEAVEREFDELAARMADPEIAADQQAYREAARRYAELEPVVETLRELRQAAAELDEARQLAASERDEEMRQLARDEQARLETRLAKLDRRLRTLLLPRDPLDDKNVVLEIRAGTGGEEAALFAADLLRMYQRYAESRGWGFELISLSESEKGGVKEAIAQVSGRGAYSRLKYESGVHRVQRVPETESQGRIHTSAATVAILPEAEEVEVEIDEDKDLRIDSFSASGPGGQHVNRTASAVRITHLPTGIVVQCQDEKSWHKNRAKAMRVLRARLLDRLEQERHAAEASTRRAQVGTGDRSQRIRTYNFPQNRVSDHRINLTLHALDRILAGELDPLLDALIAAKQAEQLAAQNEPAT